MMLQAKRNTQVYAVGDTVTWLASTLPRNIAHNETCSKLKKEWKDYTGQTRAGEVAAVKAAAKSTKNLRHWDTAVFV